MEHKVLLACWRTFNADVMGGKGSPDMCMSFFAGAMTVVKGVEVALEAQLEGLTVASLIAELAQENDEFIRAVEQAELMLAKTTGPPQ